jgi:hypothetical protein
MGGELITLHIEKKNEYVMKCYTEWRLLGRYGHKTDHNIKMNLRGIRWEGVDRIHMDLNKDQWRTLVATIIYFRVL